jgi:hypothetical protein
VGARRRRTTQHGRGLTLWILLLDRAFDRDDVELAHDLEEKYASNSLGRHGWSIRRQQERMFGVQGRYCLVTAKREQIAHDAIASCRATIRLLVGLRYVVPSAPSDEEAAIVA